MLAARQLMGRTACLPPLPNAFAQLASLGAATPTQHLLSQAATIQPVSTTLSFNPLLSLPFQAATPFNLTGSHTNPHGAAVPGPQVGTMAGVHHMSGGSGGKHSPTAHQSAEDTPSGLNSPLSGLGASQGDDQKTGTGLGGCAEAGAGPDPPAAAGSAKSSSGGMTGPHIPSGPLTFIPLA